jgi:microcystin degradation protein MlrC
MKIVVVKSPNGSRAEYEPFAKKIIMVEMPGVSTAKMGNFALQADPAPDVSIRRR